MPLRALIYVHQIDVAESSGQSAFERGLVESLRAGCETSAGRSLIVITACAPGRETPRSCWRQDAEIRLVLRRSSALGYVAHQWRLLRALLAQRRRFRGRDVAIYARYNEVQIAPALAAKMLGWPLTIRTGPIVRENRTRGHGRMTSLAIDAIFSFTCRVARHIVVVTERIAEWLAASRPYAAAKTVVLANAVDTERFRPLTARREAWGLEASDFVLVYVGALSAEYSLDVVLRALARLRANGDTRTRLLVVGEGPKRDEWRDLSRELAVETAVRWAGRRPQDDVPVAVASCDVAILPSSRASLKLKGTSAMKLFEYLACGRFVIGSRCDDLGFLEREGVGILADPDRCEEWAAAIETARARAPAAGGRARALAVEHHGFDALARRLSEIVFS